MYVCMHTYHRTGTWCGKGRKQVVIKATLFCAHDPAILTNPERSSLVVRTSLRPRRAFMATGRIQDPRLVGVYVYPYPCPHVMTRTIIINDRLKNIKSLYIVQ